MPNGPLATTARHEPLHAALALTGLIGLCQIAGASGAVITDAAAYQALVQPSWAPPSWVFAPVWITLYALMGVAAWLVWRTVAGVARRVALMTFALQLVLNAAWTPIFFGARSIGGGLIVIMFLDVALWLTILRFAACAQLAAWLMVPYAAWVGFATALNASLWILN